MGENVTPKQLIAIQTLVTTGEITQAAAAAGVATKTLHAWRKTPAFQAALRGAEAMALESFAGALLALAESTTAALRAGLDDENVSIRLRAAGLTLDALLKLREFVTLEGRLSELERRIDETQ